MEKKTIKKYMNWVAYTTDRLTACNIINRAYAIGFNGSVRRETDLSIDTPINMYKIDVYGKVSANQEAELETYIKLNARAVVSFTKNDDE